MQPAVSTQGIGGTWLCKKGKDLLQCDITQFKICFDPGGWLKIN